MGTAASEISIDAATERAMRYVQSDIGPRAPLRWKLADADDIAAKLRAAIAPAVEEGRKSIRQQGENLTAMAHALAGVCSQSTAQVPQVQPPQPPQAAAVEENEDRA